MRILLTGGRGFIGTWLARELRDAGHHVAIVDIEEGDLRRPGIAWNLLHRIKTPDVVVHLAAQVGRLHGEDDWKHTIESNAIMTTMVANATADIGANLVYTSTSEVYGDQAHQICDEDNGPFALPHNLYGLSKRWGEEACRLYAPKKLKIVRPSMPYGPGCPPGRGRRAMDNMLWQAHTRQPIPVHNGAVRSWCWIGDLVRGFRLVIEKGHPGAYNIGRDDDERSMLAIADIAVDLARAPRSLIQMTMAPGRQTVVKRLSTARLRGLGWKPEVELEEGIEKVYEWVKHFDEDGRWTGDYSEAAEAIEHDRRRAILLAA